MPLTVLQVYRNDSNGVTYMSPDKPSASVRFKTTRSPKKLGTLQTENVIEEIIATCTNQVTVGSVTVDDPISFRIRCSGSVHSEAALRELASAIAASIPAWAAEHVLVGFNPTTPPSI